MKKENTKNTGTVAARVAEVVGASIIGAGSVLAVNMMTDDDIEEVVPEPAPDSDVTTSASSAENVTSTLISETEEVKPEEIQTIISEPIPDEPMPITAEIINTNVASETDNPEIHHIDVTDVADVTIDNAEVGLCGMPDPDYLEGTIASAEIDNELTSSDANFLDDIILA